MLAEGSRTIAKTALQKKVIFTVFVQWQNNLYFFANTLQIFSVSLLKGQSHEKVGEIRPW
jgi:hypothetical protein